MHAPVQFSVFEGELEPAASRRLWRDLQKVINPEEDGLLLIPLCRGCQAGRLEAGTSGRLEVEDDVVV